MLINNAFAASAPVALQSNSLAGLLVQLVLVLIIFYVFLIKPQQRKIKEHANMVENLQIGDKVITEGGIYGIFSKLNGMEVSVTVALNVDIIVDRMSIRAIVDNSKPSAEKSNKKSKNTKRKGK